MDFKFGRYIYSVHPTGMLTRPGPEPSRPRPRPRPQPSRPRPRLRPVSRPPWSSSC